MSVDRPNAVYIGKVKDQHGFHAELLEDPDTGARFLAYDVETWWERNRYLKHLEALGKPARSLPRVRTWSLVHEKGAAD